MLLLFLYMKFFNAYFHIIPSWPPTTFIFAHTVVLLKVRQKGTLGLAYFLFSLNWNSQSDEQESPLVVLLDFHIAAISQHF